MKFEISNRKELVSAISEITGKESRYLRTPTCAYQIGEFIVEKDGNVTCDDNSELEKLAAALSVAGFAQIGIINIDDNCVFSISLPRDKVNVDNLKTIIASKRTLIKKALGIRTVKIKADKDTVLFPWFDYMPTSEEAGAFTKFISALCKMSIEQKHVNKKRDAKPANEKYAFRCFLLRLGFIGDEYKLDRKILLKNLSGSAAFRNEV